MPLLNRFLKGEDNQSRLARQLGEAGPIEVLDASTWELKDGELEIKEHPANLPLEKKYEGKYLIQTDQSDMTPEAAVLHYKDLNEVERGFRSLKDPLGMRPIWHHVDRRVKAHVFVAALAF